MKIKVNLTIIYASHTVDPIIPWRMKLKNKKKSKCPNKNLLLLKVISLLLINKMHKIQMIITETHIRNLVNTKRTKKRILISMIIYKNIEGCKYYQVTIRILLIIDLKILKKKQSSFISRTYSTLIWT